MHQTSGSAGNADSLNTPLALVWISPEGVRIFHRSKNGFLPLDRISDWVERTEKTADLHDFFKAVSRKLTSFQRIVILGPDLTKFQLRTFFLEHVPDLHRRIVGFETIGALSPQEGTAIFQKYELK